MAFPVGTANPEHMPLDVLFPEQYQKTKQMIVRDFATYLGATVVVVFALRFIF